MPRYTSHPPLATVFLIALAVASSRVTAQQTTPPVAAPAGTSARRTRRRHEFHPAEPARFRRSRGLRLAVRRRQLEGLGRNPSSGASKAGRSSANPRRRIRAETATSRYRGIEAKDFTSKFEIKVEGSGGSGIQYRSKTGIPWLARIPDNVTANVGPVDLDWMMTGPQADFWPSPRTQDSCTGEHADADPGVARSGGRRLTAPSASD